MQQPRPSFAPLRSVPVTLLALAALASGCSRPVPDAPAPHHPAVPWAAAQLSTDWTPSPSNAYTEHSGQATGRYVIPKPWPTPPPPPTLAASRVTSLLPAPPKGWWAEQVNMENSLVDDHTHYQTMASRSYARKWAASASSVQVAIRVDWGTDSTLKNELDATCAEFGAACKPVTLALGSGHEVEVEASHSTEIAILVQPNVLVQAWGQSVSAAELRAWIEKMPADGLGRLILPTE